MKQRILIVEDDLTIQTQLKNPVSYTHLDVYKRQPYRKDKTVDDRFFILTLIAIAEELTARGVDEKELYHIQLPVGLPPAHYGAQAEKFTAYFQKKGIVEFQYRDKHYAISIDDVACYPQAYAAAATMLHTLMNEAKAVVVDIRCV